MFCKLTGGCKAAKALRKSERLKRKWLKRKEKYTDKEFIFKRYKKYYGRYPEIENPKLYSEKLQWIKLYYKDPLYTQCADKYRVREYVKSKGYENILNELIGVYDSAEQIDFDSLPERFVIKATHGSGWNFICKNKSKIKKEWETYKKLFDSWLSQDYYIYRREWHYHNMQPKLICEKFLENSDGSEISDYKIFCFNGEPKLIEVDYERQNNHRRNYYDLEWKLTDIYRPDVPINHDAVNDKPQNLEEMLKIARDLSADFPHVRVDLYTIDNKIYLGELTFVEGSGFLRFYPDYVEEMMGDWLTLPKTEAKKSVEKA